MKRSSLRACFYLHYEIHFVCGAHELVHSKQFVDSIKRTKLKFPQNVHGKKLWI